MAAAPAEPLVSAVLAELARLAKEGAYDAPRGLLLLPRMPASMRPRVHVAQLGQEIAYALDHLRPAGQLHGAENRHSAQRCAPG